MNKSNRRCPICKLDQEHVEVWDYGERFSLECSRCGKFTITGTAAAVAENRALGPKLSAWIRDRTEAGAEVPEINSRNLDEIEKALPDYRVGEKQLLLLRALERRSTFPGQQVGISPEYDYPLAWAANEGELLYLLRALQERSLIRRTDGPPELTDSFYLTFEITASGWSHLEEKSRPGAITDQVFVAMSFAAELLPAWDAGIRPALVKALYRPYRIDAAPHIDRIDTKIISEIRNSRFVVADVTGQRPGVYFEAGYALGIGLPVFWSVHRDELPHVHFDTRQYNHIVWDSEAHLADQLYTFVTAIVGKGSGSSGR